MNPTSNYTVKNLIEDSFEFAKKYPFAEISGNRTINQRRSVAWIICLAKQFKHAYGIGEKDSALRCFSKHDPTNIDVFKLNEFLFDICVCEHRRDSQKCPYPYVTNCLWQVESEVEKNRCEALTDFSKLVIGNAPDKLFVGPITSDLKDFNDSLIDVAECCQSKSSRVFLASILEPAMWEKRNDPPQVFKYSKREWVPIFDDKVIVSNS